MAENGVVEVSRRVDCAYDWAQQKCPICEIEPSQFVGKRGGIAHRGGLGVETEIWKCGSCGLVFPNPMPFPKGGLSQHYDIDADVYFAAQDLDEGLAHAKKLVDEAELLLGGTGRLLDVGVGRGEVLIAAKDRGWHIEGVEPSATFADYAKKRTGAKIWRQPIEASEIQPGSFDVVVLAAVLEHLYDPNRIIEKIARVLSKGGLLYVDVPNESGLYFKFGNAYQRFRGRNWCVNLAPTFPPYHVYGFGSKSLKALLTKHSLMPEAWRVYGGTTLLPSNNGIADIVESFSSKIITAISNLGEMGTYIETWARKH